MVSSLLKRIFDGDVYRIFISIVYGQNIYSSSNVLFIDLLIGFEIIIAIVLFISISE
jgi:hypothetical protein